MGWTTNLNWCVSAGFWKMKVQGRTVSLRECMYGLKKYWSIKIIFTVTSSTSCIGWEIRGSKYEDILVYWNWSCTETFRNSRVLGVFLYQQSQSFQPDNVVELSRLMTVYPNGRSPQRQQRQFKKKPWYIMGCLPCWCRISSNSRIHPMLVLFGTQLNGQAVSGISFASLIDLPVCRGDENSSLACTKIYEDD